MTHILRRHEVGIVRIAALPTPQHFFVSLLPLDESATGTGNAGGRLHHAYSDSHDRSQQRHARAEVPRRVSFPSYESGRVFNRYASSRLL